MEGKTDKRRKADRKELGWRDWKEKRQSGREMTRDRYGRERKREGDMKEQQREREKETDSQGPHKLEHSQAKSKPPLCLCLSAKARLNKEADSSGGKL